jgi:hypothetical protein
MLTFCNREMFFLSCSKRKYHCVRYTLHNLGTIFSI